MDLNTVTTLIRARHRTDLHALGRGIVPVAGGSELFSEARPHLTGLVDLHSLGWPALTVTEAGLDIAATCTFAELSRLPAEPGWTAHPLLLQCCDALPGSPAVWNTATVGGNLATALPAAPMATLIVALNAELLVWRADGSDERMPALDFVTGHRSTVLEEGDVLRSIHIRPAQLEARTAYRRIALSPLGQAGAVLAGRVDPDGSFAITVTAATIRPMRLRYRLVPSPNVLHDDIGAMTEWFSDPHGSADWRRAVTGVLAEEIRRELTPEEGTR